MADNITLDKIRNIGIIAHIDAGKTTITERILFYSGLVHKIGEVHEGTTVTDWMEQERERGITITAAAITTSWKNHQINIIDTPGHIDFTAEVQRSLRVLDGAIVVFDGVAGVEPQSETVWRQADKFCVPRLCFINKLDRVGASFERSLASIKQRLTKDILVLFIPLGEEADFEGVVDVLRKKILIFEGQFGQDVKERDLPDILKDEVEKRYHELLEKVSDVDDGIAEKFLEEEEISTEILEQAIRKAVIDAKLFPVFCGSALKNKAVQTALDGAVKFLPSPLDKYPQKGINPETGTQEERAPRADEPFSALAFKTAADPYVGQLTFFRIYSGKLIQGTTVMNSNNRRKERIGRILRMMADERKEIKEIEAGDIGATVGLKDVATGHTLCDVDHPIRFEEIFFPEPVVSLRIEPKTKADQEKMSTALHRLSMEDPTFRVGSDIETAETIIEGMGELHLEIIIDRLRREFGVEANIGRPQVAYKETIEGAAEAEGKYIRQTGGRGQYGHVWLKVISLHEDRKFTKEKIGCEFVDSIKGGRIPDEFMPAVEKGVKETLQKGVLAGYPLVGIKVTAFDGSFHEVDSSEIAFKIAASIALKEAVLKASPLILEPVMNVEAVTPENFLGAVTGDLNSRRARIEKVQDRLNVKVISATAPLKEMFGYATAIRSLTQGRASFTMEFSHYEEVPKNLTEEIITGRSLKF